MMDNYNDFISNTDFLAALPVIIASGTCGTGLMTLYLQITGLALGQVLNVPRVLGTLVTFSTKQDTQLSSDSFAVIAGIVIHYLIGILFMAGYFLLWQRGIGSADVTTGLEIGIVSGVIAVISWSALLHFHPNPPKLSRSAYLWNVFIAHFIFVAGCFSVFLLLI